MPEHRRAGAAALSSLLGRARPAFQALPISGTPGSCWAPKTLGARPPSALGPEDSKPRNAPNPTSWLASGG